MPIREARDQYEFDTLIRKGNVVRDGVGVLWQRCGQCSNVGAPLSGKLQCSVCGREHDACASCVADATVAWRCGICATNALTH